MKEEIAVFAGGCFWGMEYAFSKIEGIIEIKVGYTGGTTQNPIYEEVSTGSTGHREAVMLRYDADVITYEELLETFWKNIDPTDENGQFLDRGSQYTTAIFYSTEKQRLLAERSKEKLEESRIFDKPVATKILPIGKFYPAEEYHQHYYLKYPTDFRMYRYLSKKTDLLKKIWQKRPYLKLNEDHDAR